MSDELRTIKEVLIERVRGDTYSTRISLTQEVSGVKQALDVTGFSFLLAVDPKLNPSDDLNNLAQIDGVIADGPNGLVDFPFGPDSNQDPSMIAAGNHFHSIRMTDTSGDTRTVAHGKFKMVDRPTSAVQ